MMIVGTHGVNFDWQRTGIAQWLKVLVCAMQKLGSTLTKIWYNIHFQLTKNHQISCNHVKTACNSQHNNNNKKIGWMMSDGRDLLIFGQ